MYSRNFHSVAEREGAGQEINMGKHTTEDICQNCRQIKTIGINYRLCFECMVTVVHTMLSEHETARFRADVQMLAKVKPMVAELKELKEAI